MGFIVRLTVILSALAAPAWVLASNAEPTPDPGYLGKPLMELQQSGPVQAPSLLPTLLNMVISVAVVVLLIYATLWLIKRWQASRAASGDVAGGEGEKPLRILERSWFDNKRGVALVEAAGEVYLVGVGESVNVLGKVTDPEWLGRLKQGPASGGILASFPHQLDKVTNLIKQRQWAKNRKTLKTQADELRSQAERLRGLGKNEEKS